MENGRIREHGERTRLAADPASRLYALLQAGLETVENIPREKSRV
jgi:hypothetical protein